MNSLKKVVCCVLGEGDGYSRKDYNYVVNKYSDIFEFKKNDCNTVVTMLADTHSTRRR